MDAIESAKKSIGKSLSKLPNAGVEKENDVFKKPPVLVEISWQTYKILGFIFFGLSFAIMKYIVDHFEKKIDDEEIISVLKIVSFFFILNFGTFLFITIYYKYIKSIKGAKGPKGNNGIRGSQGSSTSCNICEKKSGSFSKEKKTPMKNEIIETPTVLSFKPDNSNKNVWKGIVTKGDPNNPAHKIFTDQSNGIYKSFIVINPDTLGVNKNGCTEKSPGFLIDYKPIIGVSASINSSTGELYSILYLYDKNKRHSPLRYKYTPDTTKQIGSKKKGDGVEFRAPKNSAVYKVKVYNNGSIIKSVRFYCADITTGKQVKVMDPYSSKMRNYATIGISVDENDTTIKIGSVTCNKIIAIDNSRRRTIQPFISAVGGFGTEDKVCALSFTGASYLQ